MPMTDANIRRLPGSKQAQGICYACSLVNVALIIGQALTLAHVLSEMWYGGSLASQVPFVAAFFACWCARELCSYARDAYLDRFSQSAARELRARALESLYGAGPLAVNERGSASVLTTLLEGIDQVRAYLTLTPPKTADLMLYTVVIAAALLALDPMSGVIVVLMVPCTIFFMRLLGAYTKENAGKQFASYKQLANRFADSLRGMSVLKAFGAENAQEGEVRSSSEELRRRTMATLKTATLNSLVLDLFRVFALAAVAVLLGFRLMAGTVALFPALAVLMLVPELFGALRRWANDFHASLDGRNQLAAVLGIIEQKPEPMHESYLFAAGQAPSLAFHSVSFRYSNRRSDMPSPGSPSDAAAEKNSETTESLPESLSSIGFRAEGPRRVGIVGASGAGKTTLAQLIAGFSSPNAGTVEINGTCGTTLACPEWRAHVAYLPQNPHLFNDTLRANIAFYRPEATDAEIREAAEAAGLADLLHDLPQGLDTTLGEGGRALSGGQTQRVALARVFLDRNRSVLVFDEPTAHLDIETELALKPRMLQAMEGRLVFFATHRMHWMRNMDTVLVLDGGRIVQTGTFNELSTQAGPFSQLAQELSGNAPRAGEAAGADRCGNETSAPSKAEKAGRD